MKTSPCFQTVMGLPNGNPIRGNESKTQNQNRQQSNIFYEAIRFGLSSKDYSAFHRYGSEGETHRMSESVLKKYGKYFLLDRIGEGGMAEIFRSRLATEDGSGRLLVIKRILGANNANPEFVQMFKAEVQVTMRFSHPNIVQLYEAGEEQNQPYIAMEFVDGRNLRQVLGKLSSKQQRLPVPMVCHLIEQAGQGLHYAHTFKDRITGVPLSLVHRDVSPQNILVSYDGNVKVIDFGIAKAAVNGEATRAGVIKGKLSYLSPEQVMGEKLDPRSDIFALGICMWELLTGKRLFVADGENEFQVLKMIESCNTFVKPPSSINPEVPPEMDQIVLQALTRDPAKRFQNAEELARALRKLLAVKYPDFSVSDLSTFVKKLFQDHIVEDRKSLQQLNTRAEELIKLGISNSKIAHPKPTQDSKDQTRMTQFMGDKLSQTALTSADKLEVAKLPSRQVRVNASIQAHPLTHHKKSLYSSPSPVQHQKKANYSGLKSLVGIAMLGVVVYGGYSYWNNNKDEANQLIKVILAQGAKSLPSNLSGMADGNAAKQIELKINLYPDGNLGNTRITVNSQSVDPVQRKIKVPVGELIDLRVERPGYASFKQEFALKETDIGTAQEWVKDVKLEPMKYGKLSLDSVPSFADVKVVRIDQHGREPNSVGANGDVLLLKTPFVGEKLPSGNYRITIENKVLGMEKNFTVSIEEGKEVRPADINLDIKK